MRVRPPDGEAAIEAHAASVGTKCILQNLVVEPELDREGRPRGLQTACWLLRVTRKEIKKTEPIRSIIDTANDPHESA